MPQVRVLPGAPTSLSGGGVRPSPAVFDGNDAPCPTTSHAGFVVLNKINVPNVLSRGIGKMRNQLQMHVLEELLVRTDVSATSSRRS